MLEMMIRGLVRVLIATIRETQKASEHALILGQRDAMLFLSVQNEGPHLFI